MRLSLPHKSGLVEIYPDKIVIEKTYAGFLHKKSFSFSEIYTIERHPRRAFVDDAFLRLNTGNLFPVHPGSLLENCIPFSSDEEMDAAYQILTTALNPDIRQKERAFTPIETLDDCTLECYNKDNTF